VIYLTCEDALSALSLRALERVQKVRKTADGDGTETGVEVCLASEPNGSDDCRRENLLHPLLRCFDRVWRGWLGDPGQSLDSAVSDRSCRRCPLAVNLRN
jgi:hypothetical protein